jgi:hypothetical protein
MFSMAQLAEIGRAVARAAIVEIVEELGQPVFLYEIGERNARATLCGNEVGYDPLWIGEQAVDPDIGLRGASIWLFHEAGHLVDCGDRSLSEREAYADRFAAVLRRVRGYEMHEGLVALERSCVSNCGFHSDGRARVERYVMAWHYCMLRAHAA